MFWPLCQYKCYRHWTKYTWKHKNLSFFFLIMKMKRKYICWFNKEIYFDRIFFFVFIWLNNRPTKYIIYVVCCGCVLKFDSCFRFDIHRNDSMWQLCIVPNNHGQSALKGLHKVLNWIIANKCVKISNSERFEYFHWN